MKKLLIMCGTGVATSTIVTNKVKEWLKEKGLTDQVKLYQSKVADEMNKIDNYDIVVSTTVVPDSIKDRVIMGLPLLTGMVQKRCTRKSKRKSKSKENALCWSQQKNYSHMQKNTTMHYPQQIFST